MSDERKNLELVQKIMTSLDTTIIPNAENMYKELKTAERNNDSRIMFAGAIDEDLNGFLQQVELIKTWYKELVEEEGYEYPNWL